MADSGSTTGFTPAVALALSATTKLNNTLRIRLPPASFLAGSRQLSKPVAA